MLSSPRVKTLLQIALNNQSRTIYIFLLLAGFSFLFGLLMLLSLHINMHKAQQKPSAGHKKMILKRLMLTFSWTSTALAFGAALAATQLAKSLQHTSTTNATVVASSLLVEGGAGLQVLQWLAASSSLLFSAGVSSIFIRKDGDYQSSVTSSSSSDTEVDF